MANSAMSAIPPSPRCDPRDVAAQPSEIVSRSPEFPSSHAARASRYDAWLCGSTSEPRILWHNPETSIDVLPPCSQVQ
uniref:Uncharacterized protein n=1 Tax=Setaria viridis TaxID=4556 RepID=A0A4U6TW04_SETVI|nr:hypothetical protein SEVIR_7G279350v2 [Setaria viridis]